MKNYLSSISAVTLAVFCALPTAALAQEITVRNTPADSTEFTQYEKDSARAYPEYYTINPKSIRIKLLAVSEEPDMSYVKLQEQPPKDLAAILVSIDTIVNIASKVWDIVQANKPVVNLESKYATAYPQGITSASQLAQWSKPKSYLYGFYAENLYGGVMIDSKHKVTFSYNGAYKGKGKYLTAVAVIPTVASVAWGYKFYMKAAVPDSTIANVGTDTDPVAAMQLKLNWQMSSALKVVDGSSVYYVQGDGYFEEIASPWQKEWKPSAELKLLGPLQDPARVF
jgi:hypothetical protein